jgi:hypothetical protein
MEYFTFKSRWNIPIWLNPGVLPLDKVLGKLLTLCIKKTAVPG